MVSNIYIGDMSSEMCHTFSIPHTMSDLKSQFYKHFHHSVFILHFHYSLGHLKKIYNCTVFNKFWNFRNIFIAYPFIYFIFLAFEHLVTLGDLIYFG